MTPEQMRKLADRIRQIKPEPQDFQSLGDHADSTACHALAASLDGLATEIAADFPQLPPTTDAMVKSNSELIQARVSRPLLNALDAEVARYQSAGYITSRSELIRLYITNAVTRRPTQEEHPS